MYKSTYECHEMENIEDETPKMGLESPGENTKQASIKISNIDTVNNDSVFYDEHETPASGKYNEGSDSGVETNGGGVIGGVGADVTPAASCDSSLISCCYSFEDLVSHTIQLSEENRDLSITAGDGTSEGGSESSSVTSYHKHPSGVRRKTPLSKTTSSSPRSTTSPILSRSRTPLTRDRSLTSRTSSSSRSTQVCTKTVHLSRATSSPNPVPRSRKDHSESASRGPKVSNAKVQTTNKKTTPTDDGRWPSTVSKSNIQKNRPLIVSEKKSSVMTSSFSSVESKATALEKYATLPRRRRKSAENLSGNELKSSREPSLNRTASLRRSKVQATLSATLPQANTKTMPPYPRKSRPSKIKIYHEISVQTSLTGSDLQKGLCGSPLPDVHSRVDTANCGVQVDRGSELLEQLETQLKESKQQLSKIAAEKKELDQVCDKLNEERAVSQTQLLRIRALLRCKDELPNGGDVVSQLETEVASSNNLVQKQQQEISQLHSFCYGLQKELDKSYAAQKTIIQQQQEVEAESVEMQDFLQAEKSTLSETLHDMEKELSEQKRLLTRKETELLKQQEECSHLVRISEQRRQEQLSVEARLASVELRSREVLLHQGAAVSGASVALSRLGSRLEHLVDVLVTSYNISEQDLEDVIFHNEAYSQSSGSGSGRVSSAEVSPEHNSASGATGFMAAVLNAIRSATTLRNSHSVTETSSEPDQMLSAEPEPQAFSNRDITTLSTPQDIEKRHSFSSLSSFEVSPIKHFDDYSVVSSGTTDESERARLANSESLQNLSLAILRRQELEQSSEEQRKDFGILPIVLPAGSLVDQVIEVDNLVTKLLKVVRIIQAVNESTSLKERQQFMESVDELEEQKGTAEDTIAELKREIQDLRSKINNSSLSKTEQMTDLQERLTERENQLGDVGRKVNITKQLTENWSQAMSEVRRQYEAINSALEVLQSVQGLIQQNPALLKLQTDLKETNSQCATNLPNAVSPDLNANASLILSKPTTTTINGTV